MKTIVTKGIVLRRTNFQEADRIVTLLTPDQGKLRLLAKGVRRSKSKMAGGIELFSVGDITFMRGRGEMGTLVSTRLVTHYGHIVSDIDRTMFGYELLKKLDKVTEDAAEPDYFHLLSDALEGLDNLDLSLELLELWFNMQLLRLSGYTPNLLTDSTGHKLEENKKYTFDFDKMIFTPDSNGKKSSPLIKVLRLGLGVNLRKLSQVQGIEKQLGHALQMSRTMVQYHLHI